ncbi:hypothetical protein DYB36_006558 [Aphanomyces astaci]|uniref:Derlin n=1 Tax=Aphanomyces astaci TaxID=112090 RepID=A0A397AMD5_APHAT|nr:hypothetical protein DYB36_006558 [Aphanomyces astaci]
MNDPLEWYYEIPIISRLYLTGAFLTTVACALELISPFSLYFNFNLIFYRGQVWRLVTNFLFFGLFSLDFIFHMYFLYVHLPCSIEYVYPAIADIRGWRVRRILETPTFVKFLCNPHAFTAAAAPIVNDIPVAEHAEFHPHAD